GVIDAPIGRDERSVVARMVRPDGAQAVTLYETLSAGALSLVDCAHRLAEPISYAYTWRISAVRFWAIGSTASKRR
ncbi:MAG: hypothetical protein IKR84_03485, partial [Oscillibacter sp.]|nr:hypothetical protein [Oscillibacter sp.]